MRKTPESTGGGFSEALSTWAAEKATARAEVEPYLESMLSITSTWPDRVTKILGAQQVPLDGHQLGFYVRRDLLLPIDTGIEHVTANLSIGEGLTYERHGFLWRKITDDSYRRSSTRIYLEVLDTSGDRADLYSARYFSGSALTDVPGRILRLPDFLVLEQALQVAEDDCLLPTENPPQEAAFVGQTGVFRLLDDSTATD